MLGLAPFHRAAVGIERAMAKRDEGFVDLTRVNAGVILHRRAAEKMHHA